MTKRKNYSKPNLGMSLIAEEAWDYIASELQEIPSERFDAYVEASFGLLATTAFCYSTAAKENHHAYEGGLLVHTAEVLEKTLEALHGEDDYVRSVAVISAVWHDAGKTKEYLHWNGETTKLPYFYTVGHVHGSCMLLAEKVPSLIGSVDFQEIEHCILSHHCRKEWGSPVEPQTKAAMALHFADMWSSRFGEGAKRNE